MSTAGTPAGSPGPPPGTPGSAPGTPGSPGLGIYLHVPFCRTRCGYCDFNTYTPAELAGASGPVPNLSLTPSDGGRIVVDPEGYPRWVRAELDLAVRELGHAVRPVETVFVGGGTPTMLPSAALGGLLGDIEERFGLVPGAEVTTEANPDTVTPASLARLAEAGFTRVSFGMQSGVQHVLATLERTHDPDNVARAMAGAKAAGLATSLDLIYGTPGESLTDWRTSLEQAIALEPDHISAYALVVEQGTRLAVRVRRGEVAAPLDDDEADKYELADAVLSAAGFDWYEVSNWARSPEQRCRHNLAYWRGVDWWGLGPGAHSHVAGRRWWNVKHPSSYAAALARSELPVAGEEVLTDEQRYDESVLLLTRLAEGLPLDVLRPAGRAAVAGLVADELVDGRDALAGRIVLTLRGRLLADLVIRRLLP